MHSKAFEDLSTNDLRSPIRDYMVPVETAYRKDLTLQELLASLQGRKISHEVRYFYVVDEDTRLLGVITTRDILFGRPDATVESITRHDVITLPENASLEQALRLILKYELMALPIVDAEGHLQGIFELSHPRMPVRLPVSLGQARATKDVFQLIGLSVDEGNFTSSLTEYRYRMPWLLCNIAAGLLCAAIAALFSALLNKAVIIAMFIPLVLTLGESVAMQSMTLSLRFLYFGTIPWKKVFQRFSVEWRTAFLLAITCALIVASLTLFFYAGRWPPLIAIAGSVFLAMLAATIFGGFLPLLLHRLSLDPKVASGPMVLMLTDVSATALYLGLANYLIP